MDKNKRCALYCRVSTADQNCDRQLRDLQKFAKQAGYQIVETFTETASGARNDRKERAKVIALAQARKIDAVICTELTRWGRSTVDLLGTLHTLNEYNVSVVAEKGVQFDLGTAQGKMIAGMLSVLSQFERDLISERTRSGLAATVARGTKLGRPKGHRTANKLRPTILQHISEGKSYRQIAKILGISTTTILLAVKSAK